MSPNGIEESKGKELPKGSEKVEGVESKGKQFSDAQKAEVATKFDEQQENKEKATYEKNKIDIIKNISNWKLNPEYNTVDPNNMEYKNKLLLSDDTNQVKAYVAYYNAQTAKENAQNNTDVQLINIDTFMTQYEREKPKATDNIKKENGPDKVLNPQVAIQEVGKFVDLTPDKQEVIATKIGEVISAEQKINKIVLHGYADATQVNTMGEKVVKEKFTALRQILVDKGIDTNKLPSSDYLQGSETMEEGQKQKLLNEGRAYTRAMMQIAFLPPQYIKYINDNTTTLAIDIDAKSVGGAEKGKQYTGGKIEMQVTGSEKITREKTVIEARLLKMIDIRQIDYAYKEGNQYYFVGGINLSNTDGKLDIHNIKLENRQLRSLPLSGLQDKENTQTSFSENKNTNTLYIVINDPKKVDEKAKTLADIDDRVIKSPSDIGMNLIDENNKLGSFKKSLTEFKNKSAGDTNKEKYVDNILSILETYEEVHNELTRNKEEKNIVF